MKTAIWIYLFMFIAMFDLHAQFPILSPFAISLGAAPSFIGLIMGVYSLTHIPGNMIAGYGIDRFGSKFFIVISLIGAGILLLFQSQITDPWQLLVIRSISGFILAFLSPACLTFLAALAKDKIQQGHLMSGNGIVHTTASIISPAAGAVLVLKAGFETSFYVLGWGLIVVGFLAIFFVKNIKIQSSLQHLHSGHHFQGESTTAHQTTTLRYTFYIMPLAMSCSQGILYFELPLIALKQDSLLTSGIMFSVVSIGALITLSLIFLNRYSPSLRTAFGGLTLAIVFFGMAIHWPISLYVSLFIVGMAKGIIYPAMITVLTNMTPPGKYGRIFAMLSISFSVGAFIGPIAAGYAREHFSPFFLAFVVLMIALSLIPIKQTSEVGQLT